MCEGFDHHIDCAQWIDWQLWQCSVPTRVQQLVQQRMWYVLSCLWESAYKRSFAAYQKE